MAVDAALSALMLQTVTWQPRSSLNSYGEPSFGASVAVNCRIERKNEMVMGPDGQQYVSSAQVYTDQIRGIAVTDLVTLDDGNAPSLISVQVHWDEEGPSHEVLYLS